MDLISVIVPLYRGEKYIPNIISQIVECQRKAKSLITIELIMVNDFPDIKICDNFVEQEIEIKLINLKYNKGIHGARLVGLSKSEGTYILFLDQDDRIFPEFFNSQLNKIGDADAVVSQAIDAGRLYYDNRRPFRKVVSKDYMLDYGNYIISPGQVLIKKESIPNPWIDNVMKNNGADDWLLWLCMYGVGKKIELNEDILYEHIIDGENASWNTESMMYSELEAINIIKVNKVLNLNEISRLERLEQYNIHNRIKQLDHYKRMFYLYDEWLKAKNRGIHMESYFFERHYKKIAIYGVSDIGRQIYLELLETKVEVDYFIDKNAKYVLEKFPVFLPEDVLSPVDVIVISLIDEIETIIPLLRKKMNTPIIEIREVLKDMTKNI